MQHLLKLIALMCAAITLLCVGARVVGHAWQESDALPDLDTCDGVPCYMGIVLNATTAEEAKRIFVSRPDLSLIPPGHGAQAAEGPLDRIATFTSATGTIFEFYLKIRAGFLTVGNLIRDLGVPCAVYTIGMANGSPKIVVLSF